MRPPSPAPHPRDEFACRVGRPCFVVARAPGRVNLIGEHTDYNEGFVLPMALEQSTWGAAAPRDDGHIRVVATDLDDERTWSMQDWSAARYPAWTRYIAGVAELLHRRGARLDGADVLIRSEVPVGGGLSSSAALEVATALALGTIGDRVLGATELADLCRSAEHEFAQVPCGIMDQYVSVLAQAGCAFLLDCRTRTWEHIPLDLHGHTVLVVNSGVHHALAASEYALRQQQCRDAVAFFRQRDPRVRALRDVSADLVRQHAGDMDRVLAARARHVTTENERTLAAAAALRRGDLAEFGRLMSESHRSLRDDYQVSCPELDRLVEIVGAVPGVLGVRMTGGGFGGCVVAIARDDSIAAVEAAVHEKYDATGDGPAHVIQTRPGAGAAIEVSGV